MTAELRCSEGRDRRATTHGACQTLSQVLVRGRLLYCRHRRWPYLGGLHHGRRLSWQRLPFRTLLTLPARTTCLVLRLSWPNMKGLLRLLRVAKLQRELGLLADRFLSTYVFYVLPRGRHSCVNPLHGLSWGCFDAPAWSKNGLQAEKWRTKRLQVVSS